MILNYYDNSYLFPFWDFQEHADNESVTSDIAGQALVENVAHKLFVWADSEDRAARFNK